MSISTSLTSGIMGLCILVLFVQNEEPAEDNNFSSFGLHPHELNLSDYSSKPYAESSSNGSKMFPLLDQVEGEVVGHFVTGCFSLPVSLRKNPFIPLKVGHKKVARVFLLSVLPRIKPGAIGILVYRVSKFTQWLIMVSHGQAGVPFAPVCHYRMGRADFCQKETLEEMC